MKKHETDVVDSIGKREQKRKHKRYMPVDDKYVRIGQEWKHQPFTGRPHKDGMFMDMFRISEYGTIDEHPNWGTILAKARQHIKDNAHEYYETERKVVISGRVKRTGEWVILAEFDAIKNYWFM